MGASQIPAASAGGVNQFTQTFNASGTFTAPATCNSVEIILVGGGGGAGGVLTPASANECRAAGGGGGGQVIRRRFAVTPNTGYTVTIGNGGAGGVGAAVGSVGGDSSFGSLATALGGGGGSALNLNNAVIATPRATSGGQASSGNQINAGAGGGAGGSATFFTLNNPNPLTASVWVLSATNNMNGISGGQGNFASNDKSNIQYGGIGIEGFGAGGAGGYAAFSAGYTPSTSMTVFNGIAPVIQQGGQTALNGTNAPANTGHGGNGGGATSNGTSLSSTGGNGGSGICIVNYLA